MADATDMHEENPDGAAGATARDSVAVLGMITGAYVSQITWATAVLRIPDHIADGVETADEIARVENSDPRTTFRLMRAASSLGLLTYKGENRFGLTPRGHLLRADVPGSPRAMVVREIAAAATPCSRWSPSKISGLRFLGGASRPLAAARPLEYGGSEYAGLPVKAAVFAIMLCSDMFQLPGRSTVGSFRNQSPARR
jgi:hypothetical protein